MKDLLLLACHAALKGGREIMQVYETDFKVDVKEDNSPLTIADEKSHSVIYQTLSGNSPYPVMSEEGTELDYSIRINWNRFWCVDPLDGTREFIKRNGEFTVNIALIEDRSPVLGVIYIPVTDVLYAATEGVLYRVDGAMIEFQSKEFRLEKFIFVPENGVQGHEVLRVLVSRSHLSKETRKYIAELESTYPAMEYLSAGSALKFGWLAEGKADQYPRFSPCMEWDTAAGHAILKTAGKNIFVYPSGEEMMYNKINLVNDWFIAR